MSPSTFIGPPETDLTSVGRDEAALEGNQDTIDDGGSELHGRFYSFQPVYKLCGLVLV